MFAEDGLVFVRATSQEAPMSDESEMCEEQAPGAGVTPAACLEGACGRANQHFLPPRERRTRHTQQDPCLRLI